MAGAGDEENAFASLRYGGQLFDDVHGRAYLKFNDRDDSHAPLLGRDAGDGWQASRAGFRLDGSVNEKSKWTFQGDVYETDENELFDPIIGPTAPADIDRSFRTPPMPRYSFTMTAPNVTTALLTSNTTPSILIFSTNSRPLTGTILSGDLITAW